MHEPSRARFPSIGAALSFVFPGLGQAYARQYHLAFVLAAPMLLLVGGIAVAILLTTDEVRRALFNAQFLTALLVLDVALLAWRVFAIAHAGLALPSRPRTDTVVASARARPVLLGMQPAAETRMGPAAAMSHLPEPNPVTAARPPGSVAGTSRLAGWTGGRRPWEMALLVVLLLATVGMHAWTGLVINRLGTTLDRVFAGGTTTGSPGTAGATTAPLNNPQYHWDGTKRISFLLLGIDSGAYRSEALTDTILVVSVDPVKRTAVMISIPRDTTKAPLPDRRIFADGLYPYKINSLTTIASQNRRLWCPDLPSSADCGIRTLERTVGLMVGVEIDYYATVNLTGFAKLIDALGGLELCIPGTLADPTYGGPTWGRRIGVVLHPGCQRLDGPHALAYARVRKGTMTMPDGTVVPQDDFKRAARQQEVLLALRAQFASANWLFTIPALLDAVGETVTTDFPRGDAGNLASLLPEVASPGIKRVVLSLPDYQMLGPNPKVNYQLIPRRDAIRKEMQRLFGATALKGWYLATTDLRPPRTGS